jgi:hypothetical protein
MRYVGVVAALATAVCVLAGAAAARTLATPTITSIGPPKATAGQKVAIYGTGLSDTIAVQFNGIDALKFTVLSDTHVNVIVPSEATGTGPITVLTKTGEASSTMNFTVATPSLPRQQPGPRITTFMPVKGVAGTHITIRGAYLGGALWVKLDRVKIPFTVPSATRVVAVVPKTVSPGKHKLWLRTSGGMATKVTMFTVLPGGVLGAHH